MQNKQLIIIGGGASIKEGIRKELWNKLNNKLTLGLNYSYKYFVATAQIYTDRQFYVDENKNKNFQNLPLIIGDCYPYMKNISKDTYMIPSTGEYDKSLKTGCYKSSLCGLYALSLAIFLQPKEIYLLGYDYGDEIIHRNNMVLL